MENNNKKWTKDEKDYTIFNWGFKSIDQLSKILNRKPSAIQAFGYRNGLGVCHRCDRYSTVDIARILKVDQKTVTEWCKTKKLSNNRYKINVKQFYSVHPDALIIFLQKYPKLWNANNVEEFALEEEYDWLIEKRKTDKDVIFRTEWTVLEERQLIKYIKDGLTSPEISKLMKGRTLDAIRDRRCYLTGIYPELKLNVSLTKSQKKYIEDNWTKISVEEMAETVNKPVHTVIRYGHENKLGSRFKVDGLLIGSEVAKIIGATRGTILTWSKKGLKFTTQNNELKTKMYSLDNVLTFLIENKDSLRTGYGDRYLAALKEYMKVNNIERAS